MFIVLTVEPSHPNSSVELRVIAKTPSLVKGVNRIGFGAKIACTEVPQVVQPSG
jgi:hypothetical protein